MSPFLLGLTMARLSLCQHGGPPVAPHDPARLDWLGTDYTGLWSTVDAMDRAEALMLIQSVVNYTGSGIVISTETWIRDLMTTAAMRARSEDQSDGEVEIRAMKTRDNLDEELRRFTGLVPGRPEEMVDLVVSGVDDVSRRRDLVVGTMASDDQWRMGLLEYLYVIHGPVASFEDRWVADVFSSAWSLNPYNPTVQGDDPWYIQTLPPGALR